MRISKNTLQKGTVRYIVFQEDKAWYAVGLEFNLIETGDTPQEAMMLLFEAIAGYVESARKIKARPTILNQVVDKEYEIMWRLSKEKKSSKKTKPIFSSGFYNILNSSLVPA